jgi:hypothetical protein
LSGTQELRALVNADTSTADEGSTCRSHRPGRTVQTSTANEKLLEVYRTHLEAQDKYAYFLVANGAAIGLAVTQTQGSALAWSQLSLAAAVLSWGASSHPHRSATISNN